MYEDDIDSRMTILKLDLDCLADIKIDMINQGFGG